MSLTSIQRDQARYKGSADIKKRKSYLKRSATAIRQLADESTKDWSALHGTFSEKELKLIRAAGTLIDRATSHLAADIREADAIQARYDKDVKAAVKALATLPRASVEEMVVILAAERSCLNELTMDTIRRLRWPDKFLGRLVDDAIQFLSWSCARARRSPAEFVAEIEQRAPELKAQHADLIRELNGILVAAKMEEANECHAR